MNNRCSWIVIASCLLFLIGCNDDSSEIANSALPASNVTAIVLAGSDRYGFIDGSRSTAAFNRPAGLAVDNMGYIYVADSGNNKIRKISVDGVVTTIAGSGRPGSTDGVGMGASFDYPSGVAVDQSGTLYVADTANNKIRKITPDGTVTTLAGSGQSGSTDGIGMTATFDHPSGIVIDAEGSLYIADTNSNKIRKITTNGTVKTLAGSGQSGSVDGIGTAATFDHPSGIAIDAEGSLYVADTNSNKIRKITIDGTVTTLAGSGQLGSDDGTGFSAAFAHPSGIAVDPKGIIYVTDSANNKIRKIVDYGVVTTVKLADNGNGLSITHPIGIAIDASKIIYITNENMIETLNFAATAGSPLQRGTSSRYNGGYMTLTLLTSIPIPSRGIVECVYMCPTGRTLSREFGLNCPNPWSTWTDEC